MAKTKASSKRQNRKTTAGAETGERRGLIRRLHDALGPIAGGIILDLVDFATFGPIGVCIGWLVGGLVGWWIASLYDFSLRGRIIFAILAAAYCTVPFTAPFPLATVISAIARFLGPERKGSG